MEACSREHCGFPNSCDENAVRGNSVPADCKNIQHLLLLTAEGSKLSCRMTNMCFQFLVFVVLGSHQGHCCYCCKNTAAGWCLWSQGKETQSGRDGWGHCGCQDVSWGVCVKPHVGRASNSRAMCVHLAPVTWKSSSLAITAASRNQGTSGIPTSGWWLAVFILYLLIPGAQKMMKTFVSTKKTLFN